MLTACWFAAIGLLVFQTVLVAGFVRATRASSPGTNAGRNSRVLVVLCARGNDPSLADCLARLEPQLEGEQELLFVTDRADDPAVAVLERHRQIYPASRAQVWVAAHDSPQCSLKCQSLAGAVGQYSGTVDWLVTIDSDAVPAPDWLTRLTTGGAQNDVAAVFGHRWFVPPSGNSGGWLRFLWNAAAIVQMHWYRIPWGGSLAIRWSAVQVLDLTAVWRRALFEDVLLSPLVAANGRRVQSIATLYSVSGESCSLGEAWQWMVRQLLDVRLYHPRWSWVVGHAVAAAILPLAFLGCAVGYGIQGAWPWAGWAVASLVGLQLANIGLLVWICRGVDAALSRGFPSSPQAASAEIWTETTPSAGWWSRWSGWGWVGLLPWLHLAAVLRAALVRRMTWRGIEYDVRGPWEIQRGTYRPQVTDSRS